MKKFGTGAFAGAPKGKAWLLAGAAVAAMAAASPAAAVQACGADGPGADTLSCPAGTYASGITFSNSDGLTLNLNDPGIVVQGQVQVAGGAANTNDIVVNATNFGSITSTASAGISAGNSGAAGNVAATMDAGSVTTTGNLHSGLTASYSYNGSGSGSASATLNGGSITTSGQNSSGVAAGTGVATPGGNAVVTMTGGTVQTSGRGSNGLNANVLNTTSTGGTSVFMSGGSVTVTGDTARGIVSLAQGSGNALVRMSGGTVQSSQLDGIYASARGAGVYDVAVTGGSVTGGMAPSGAVGGPGAAISVDADAGGTLAIGSGATINAGGSGVAIFQTGGIVNLTTGGRINGAVNLAAVANTLTVTGGSITGDVAGGGLTTLTIDTAAGDSFTYSSGHTMSGIASVTMTGGSARIDGTIDTSGAMMVNGGDLRVNGVLGGAASSLTVASGGRLGGNGVIGGSATIQSGGVVAPGNSIGTLHVNGAFTQAAGSTYEMEVDPTSNASDRISVTGAATLTPGAGLKVIKTGPGDYRPGAVYTVLEATGGVSGTYALSGDLQPVTAFIGLKDSYDANHVYLTVVQTRSLTDAAGTPNQEAIAGALPTGSPVGDAVLNLPSDAAAQQAFDQLSGESQAASKGVLVNDSRLVRDLAMDRVRGMLCAPGTTDRALQEAKGCLGDHAQPTAWAQGFGAWGHSNSTANASGAQRSTGGFLIGADMPLAAIGRAGVFAGYSHTGVDVDSGVSDIDSYHAGLYGGLQRGPVGLRAGASFTYNAVDSTRSVAFDGFQDRLKASYAAYTSQGYAEAGYELPTPGPVSVEGFANVAYASVHSQGFTEKGGPAALTAAAQDTGVTYATLGVRPSVGMSLPGAEVALRGMVGWRSASGDITPVSRVAFAGGTPFTVAGVPLARNSAVAEFGADLRLSSRAVLGVTYAGQYSARDVDQSVRAVLSVRF